MKSTRESEEVERLQTETMAKKRDKILTLHESVLGCMAQSNQTTACTVGILIGMQLV